jgi:hypothetical protein
MKGGNEPVSVQQLDKEWQKIGHCLNFFDFHLSGGVSMLYKPNSHIYFEAKTIICGM